MLAQIKQQDVQRCGELAEKVSVYRICCPGLGCDGGDRWYGDEEEEEKEAQGAEDEPSAGNGAAGSTGGGCRGS